MKMTADIEIRGSEISISDYSEIDDFLTGLDDRVSDWAFTKRIIAWAEDQKKLAAAEGVDL